ncbi:hypothetical protein [Candidatus Mycoplasma haematominutum]|nr:hypothetical protein [Candidatus Mycoplasma haematominutum]
MAITLANKKINTYSFELGLILLIPGAFFVFLLPASLRETGIVVILGAFIMLALWLLVSNFYFPSFISSIASDRKFLLSRKALATQQSTELELDTEKPRPGALQTIFGVASKAPVNLYSTSTPFLFILGGLGLVLWLSHFELTFPRFFKGNKLLTINENSKNLIENNLKGLNGQFRELKNIPQQIAAKSPNTVNLLYYLFPETANLESIISTLTNGKDQKKNQDSTHLHWTLQSTDAFSIMPALKSLLKLIFWSTLPLSCYCALRFNLASALSLSLSSLMMIGLNFLFMLSSNLSTSNLFPEIILVSFLMLLAFWIQTIVRGRLFHYPPNNHEKKDSFFKSQGYDLKCQFHTEGTPTLYLLAFCIGLTLSVSQAEIIYAILLLLIFNCTTHFLFIPLHCRLWAKLRYLIYTRAFKIAYFFINRRQHMQWRPEEENVLGINI